MNASIQRRLRAYTLEAKYECLKQFRIPAQIIFTLGFPLMFYAVFGVIFGLGAPDGNPYGLRYIALYGAFSTIGASLYGFGVGVATERGQGWMLLKRASPMPPEGYFIAKLAMSLVSAMAIVLLLTGMGVALFGVRIAPPAWCEMFVLLVLGVVPFCALGLAIGYWSGPNSAVALVNLINIPMALLSGLWIPLNVLPASVQAAARFQPAYHYSQLALGAIGQNEAGSTAGHLLVLVGFLALALAIAYAGYRRDEDKTYG